MFLYSHDAQMRDTTATMWELIVCMHVCLLQQYKSTTLYIKLTNAIYTESYNNNKLSR